LGNGDELMMSSFVFMEPWQTIRMGLIPFWTAFSVQKCVKSLEDYVRMAKEKGEEYTKARAFLFSHGTDSIGIASLDQWKGILQNSDLFRSPISDDDVFVGVATEKYPKDFACIVNYNPDMKIKIKERYIMPPTLNVDLALDFFSREGSKHVNLL